jgi:hypothetical protein
MMTLTTVWIKLVPTIAKPIVVECAEVMMLSTVWAELVSPTEGLWIRPEVAVMVSVLSGVC